MAAEQAAAGASALPAANAGDAEVYKGVTFKPNVRPPAVFSARCSVGGVLTMLGSFCTAAEAARAHDDASRKAGRRVVNFPRPGSDEVQAVKGEKEEVTLLRHTGECAPPRSGPLPPASDYKGVFVYADARTIAVYAARFKDGSVRQLLGRFCTAEQAARAYDDAVRNAGRRVVNFPRPGTDEVQAVKGEMEEVTLLRHTGECAPPRSGPPPPASDYKGVFVYADARTNAVYAARFKDGSVRQLLGRFCTAEQAARAYDDAARKTGRRVVNFPRPGTDEVQAVKDEKSSITLRRHAAAQQEAGGVGAAGGIASASTALPALKRRAAAPPLSEPPRKRAIVRSSKSEAPAAEAPEAPAAPPPPRYTRHPPHRIGPAASPPADDVPGLDAPASGIKTESPAAVKPEAPVAPRPACYTRRPPQHSERESSLPPGFVAPASGIKTPAAVKPEAPVAPPHVPYTASTGRPLQAAFAAAQAALAASLPPDDGPGLDAPAAGIKTETPATVKAETPAPPPASAAAAPPVKMELD